METNKLCSESEIDQITKLLICDPLNQITLPEKTEDYTEEHWQIIEDSIRMNRIGSSPEQTECFANMARRARLKLQMKRSRLY